METRKASMPTCSRHLRIIIISLISLMKYLELEVPHGLCGISTAITRQEVVPGRTSSELDCPFDTNRTVLYKPDRRPVIFSTYDNGSCPFLSRRLRS